MLLSRKLEAKLMQRTTTWRQAYEPPAKSAKDIGEQTRTFGLGVHDRAPAPAATEWMTSTLERKGTLASVRFCKHRQLWSCCTQYPARQLCSTTPLILYIHARTPISFGGCVQLRGDRQSWPFTRLVLVRSNVLQHERSRLPVRYQPHAPHLGVHLVG